MGGIKHGTYNAYKKAGCRCPKCTDANSAHAWAQRKTALWDAPVGSHVIVVEGLSINGGKIVMPSAIVAEAINNLAERIKTEALSILWRYKKRDGVPL